MSDTYEAVLLAGEIHNELTRTRADLAKAQAEVAELRARIDRSVCLDSGGERIHFGARVVCGQCFDSQGQHLKNLKAEVAELRAQLADAEHALHPAHYKENKERK